MGWLALSFILIAAFAIPRFGMALLGTILVCAMLIGLLFFLGTQNSKRNYVNAPQTTIIHLSAKEIDLVDLNLLPESYDKSSFRLTGRVRNKSALYGVTEMHLKLTVQDCVNPPNECETVGEQIKAIYVPIPSLQSRDLNEYVNFFYFAGFKGQPKWIYNLIDVEAR